MTSVELAEARRATEAYLSRTMSPGRYVSRIDEIVFALPDEKRDLKKALFESWSSMETAWAVHLADGGGAPRPEVMDHIDQEARAILALLSQAEVDDVDDDADRQGNGSGGR